jgi:hypothetical protein
MAQLPLMDQGLFVIDALRSHSDTSYSVGLLRTSDQHDAETSTLQNTTLTSDRHPGFQRDSNPQSQHANLRPRGHWGWWVYIYENIKCQTHISDSIEFSIITRGTKLCSRLIKND